MTDCIRLGVLVDSPFYDPDLIAYRFRIPDRLKIRGCTQKYVQRASLNDFLPPRMAKRSKTIISFRPDIKLADVLETLARRVLTDAAVRERGLFDPQSSGASCGASPDGPTRGTVQSAWERPVDRDLVRIFVDRRGDFPVDPLWRGRS